MFSITITGDSHQELADQLYKTANAFSDKDKVEIKHSAPISLEMLENAKEKMEANVHAPVGQAMHTDNDVALQEHIDKTQAAPIATIALPLPESPCTAPCLVPVMIHPSVYACHDSIDFLQVMPAASA